ncbi:hypothetical protein CCACVL1_14940 [Corchorus capsularis]|uniref:Uncharacterized protein n=1 Tax=Corchorus capsularis TaxID=210143 RepID=A0A1R3I4U6_COCAP|nr:hypothetical protein CCACVL1_14940 [Corchorus capsularis]
MTADFRSSSKKVVLGSNVVEPRHQRDSNCCNEYTKAGQKEENKKLKRM